MKKLVVLAVLSAILGALAPKGRENGIKKIMAFVTGVVLLTTVAEPIVHATSQMADLPKQFFALFMPSGEDMKTETEKAKAWVIWYSKENIESGVQALLSYRYGVSVDFIEVHAITEEDDTGNWILSELIVSVDRDIGIPASQIARYVGDMLGCPCRVLILE